MSGRSVMRRRGGRAERGAVAVPTMIMIYFALLAFFAMAFNTGLITANLTELQNGADSAALAGARSLDGTATGLGNARTSAYSFSTQHETYGEPITIDTSGDVTFGAWHLKASECTYGIGGTDCFETLTTKDPRKITAVKITNGRDGATSHNSPLNLPIPFGFFIGTMTAKPKSAAVAVGGGSAAPGCAMPFAVAECKIVDQTTGNLNCGTALPLTFSNANHDGLGFINLYYPADKNDPSGNWVADTINGAVCDPSHYQLGDAKLQDGNDFNDKVIQALQGVDNKGKTVGPCWIGKTVSWAVTDAGCPSNPDFHGVQTVVGFVKAVITEVTDNKGNALGCPGTVVPPVDGSPMNAMVVEFPCDAATEAGDFGGGRAYNTSTIPVRLVQ
jgi:hypothetical protein